MVTTRMLMYGRKHQQGVNWITAIAMGGFHIGAVAALFYIDLGAILTAVVLWIMAGSFGIGMGYHRLLTHRGFKTPRWVEYFLTLCGTLALEGGPIFWVATHRIHHQKSDKEGDPHTPREGSWWAHMGWILFGEGLHHDSDVLKRYVPDLARDPFHVALSTWHWTTNVVVGLVLLAFGGIPYVLWGIFFRTTWGLHSTWLVNSATHLWGSRRYQTRDDSTNNWWVALLTFGEGWHNNHHAHPTSARHGLAWYEFDFNWIGISTLKALGLAWDVKRARIAEPVPHEANETLVLSDEEAVAENRHVTRRQKAIAFFVALCVLLVAAAISLNVGWIVINARRIGPLILGIISFALIIAGLIVYTVFLVLEIKRNEDHDTFINAVTHELKTPIASMRLYLQTLQSRDVDEARRREFYDIMLEDADRLHRTVEQVLKAGASGQKAKIVARAPVDMAALATECVRLAATRHHLPGDAIALEAYPASDAGDLMVNGDADELRTVLTNLLDNAVKYSGTAVNVTVSVAAPAPDTVWVRVQDRGVGIPRKQLKRIFKRFYRVQARGLKHIAGTGLGLYIVRSIARAHGGRVFAQSEGEGRGATFTLELPRLAS